MRDFQKIVDDVRSSMYAAGPEADATVRTAMQAYADACRETNMRLQKCGDLLKAGLRSEALQLCEIEPNVLDAVATLDFPERDTWVQIVARRGIAASPPLAIDIAGDLNDAYAIEQPMETLLARHRLLALARSPLLYRVRTLRDLAEVDPDNPVWGEDLLLFERERYKEIQQEAMEASAAGDVGTIAQLDGELRTSLWMETPPEGLIRLVSDAKTRLKSSHARQEMQRIERQLNEAFSEFDLARGRQLREEWNELLQIAAPKENDPLLLSVRPAFDWLDQENHREQAEEEHASAIAALERDLDDEKAANVLERAYHAAVRYELGIPALLEQRYRSRMASLKSAARRRTRLLLGGIVMAAMLIAGSVGWLFWSNMRATEVAQHAKALQTLMDDQQVSEAVEYLDRLDRELAHVGAAPALAEIRSAVQQAAQKDRDRKSTFARTTDGAKALLAKDIGDWKQIDQARELLDEAGRHAKLENDRVAIAELRGTLEQHEQRVRAADMDAFDKEFKPLLERVRRLGDARQMNPEERDAAAERLRVEAQSLKTRFPRVDVHVNSQVNPIVTRLAAIKVDAQASLEMRKRLEQLTTKVGNFKEYAAALGTYAGEHSREPRSGSFRRVVEEAALWENMQRLNQAAEQWGGQDVRRLTQVAATKMLEDFKVLSTAAPAYPNLVAYKQLLPYLESAVRRADAATALNKALRSPWVVDAVWSVRMKNGQTYYLRSRPIVDGMKLNKCVIDFALLERQRSFKEPDVEEIGKSPQTTLGEQISALINQPDAQRTWEEKIMYSVNAILADKSTDPVCRFELLKKILEAGSQGSQCVAEAFAEQLGYLTRQKVNVQANWLDPENRDGQENRQVAITALSGLPDVRPASRRLVELWNDTRAPEANAYRWVGWLARLDNEWQCLGPRMSEVRGQLAVVRRDAAKDALKIDVIAAVDAGGLTLVPGVPGEALVEGRPVFLVEPKTAPPPQ